MGRDDEDRAHHAVLLEERVREAMRPFDIPILIVVCVLAGWFFYRRLKSRRAESVSVSEEASE